MVAWKSSNRETYEIKSLIDQVRVLLRIMENVMDNTNNNNNSNGTESNDISGVKDYCEYNRLLMRNIIKQPHPVTKQVTKETTKEIDTGETLTKTIDTTVKRITKCVI